MTTSSSAAAAMRASRRWGCCNVSHSLNQGISEGNFFFWPVRISEKNREEPSFRGPGAFGISRAPHIRARRATRPDPRIFAWPWSVVNQYGIKFYRSLSAKTKSRSSRCTIPHHRFKMFPPPCRLAIAALHSVCRFLVLLITLSFRADVVSCLVVSMHIALSRQTKKRQRPAAQAMRFP